MLKKRVVAAVAAALMAGSASAVEVSRDGVGDFLIAPAYFIGGGLTTDLKVVNTHPTLSTVAKVVFRDRVTSAELLDFMVYLSPNDVWEGRVSCLAANAAGQCTSSEVRSADDSSQQLNSESFATAASPLVIVNNGADGRSSLPNEGYVDIEMGPTFALAPNQSPRDGVSKPAIRAAYVARQALGSSVGELETPNILAGYVTANHPALGRATIPMVALEDYDTAVLPTTSGPSGFDSLGQRTPVRDVEEALWKNNAVVPYDTTSGQIGLVTMTFPTKLTYNNAQDGQYPFASTVCFVADMFDTEEQTIRGGIVNVSPRPTNPQTCATEFDFRVFGQAGLQTGTFNTGWARVRFANPTVAVGQTRFPADSTNVGRSGVPAIITYMNIDQSRRGFTWSYAATHR